MAAVVLICAGLLGFSPSDRSMLGVSASDRSEYQAATARAGRDAGAHLKLAVWCEAHGLDAERIRHLATAMAADPQNAAVRGMMGLVSYRGKWLPPEKVGEVVKSDEAMAAKLAEYEAKRQKTPEFAQAQWDLALWCEENGLKAEATAHFTAVTQLDPKRADAWRKLGCELSHGRWVHADQASAQRAEEEAQKAADRHWEPILLHWKNQLESNSPRHNDAVAVLEQINDPRAVPMIHKVLARGSQAQQEMAAQMLGRIECPASSHALASLALYNAWPEGRSFAIGELKRRDPRDYMDDLIRLMHRPFAYRLDTGGPQGNLPKLVIDGEQTQMHRVYRMTPGILKPTRLRRGPAPAPPAFQMSVNVQGGQNGINRFLLDPRTGQLTPATLMEQQEQITAGQARTSTQQAMQREIATVESFNEKIRGGNRIVGETLTEITGERLGDDPDTWLKWWNDKQGLRYEKTEARYKKTSTQYVRVPFPVHHSCFAAGTPVPTLTGPRPIESLKLGDVILSQDTVTGVLSYQPIVGVHHNPPAETVRIHLKDGDVVSTPVHRFWRPGRGWAMARDLKPGESIRTVGGRVEVAEISPEVVQPVFNLDVANTHSFFVGSQTLLVRDNSLPPAMSTPFDAEPSLAAVTEGRTAPSERRHDEPRNSMLGGATVEPGSIWVSVEGSSSRSKTWEPAQRQVEPAGRTPR